MYTDKCTDAFVDHRKLTKPRAAGPSGHVRLATHLTYHCVAREHRMKAADEKKRSMSNRFSSFFYLEKGRAFKGNRKQKLMGKRAIGGEEGRERKGECEWNRRERVKARE